MRLAPIAIFYSPNVEQLLKYSAESSRTTHAAAECLDACCYFASLLHIAFSGENKEGLLHSTLYKPETEKVKAIAAGEYLSKDAPQIKGSGYVIDCLEAALWCFATTDTFEAAILKAANLGDDADTTAAVCGQIAGAYYGESGIKKEWLDKLFMRDEITTLVKDLKNFSVS